MNLEIKELKKIMYDFNRVSERLMHTDFADFLQNVDRFIAFLDGCDVIKEFIGAAGHPTFEIEDEVKEVIGNRDVFDIGNDDMSEVANIYSILHYITDNQVTYHSMIFYGYSHGSNKYQDMLDGFNSRVTLVLISHIEAYLTRMGYEMELDQQTKNINNNFYGSINTVGLQQGDNNTMNNYNQGVDYEILQKALSEIMNNKQTFKTAFGDETEIFNEKLDQLISIVEKKETPSLVKTLVADLRGIAVAAGGNLVAAGVLALLPNYVG